MSSVPGVGFNRPPAGGGGGGSAGYFEYDHSGSSAASWTISHGLNSYPVVAVVDNFGAQVVADVTYIDSNTIQIDFTSPFSGKAYLN